jgi:Fe-S-cluster-containing dehydrogenase component/DMSO reductase anchor subunit
MVNSNDNFATPVDSFFERNRLQTPVAKFSAAHDRGAADSSGELIPLSAPKEGEQYAFEVNLDLCTGCKACVVACHSMNGLDESESWRDVGTITGGTAGAPYTQTVTTACHHCEDPGCLNGCPVLAYEKDESTGIVHHLDDQCIGCEYCVMKCPYDVPKYNPSLGIVRKCDMCYNRLAAGEAPACVQACPNEAISITVVKQGQQDEKGMWKDKLVPGAPDSAITKPTTKFITEKSVPVNTRGIDADDIRAEHAHWPLVWMLTLTQGSVGLISFTGIRALLGHYDNISFLIFGALLGYAGLCASVFHLGKPLKAWRFFLGLKTSWLSREILVFSTYAGLLPLCLLPHFIPAFSSLFLPVLLTTMITGLLGVYCSAKIYESTNRVFWKSRYSHGKFFGTALSIGLIPLLISDLSFALIAASVVRLAWEFSFLVQKHEENTKESLNKSVRIMRELLPLANDTRFLSGAFGGVFIPMLLTMGWLSPALAVPVCFLSVFMGEVAQRYLYFRAVVSLKMPGGVVAK